MSKRWEIHERINDQFSTDAEGNRLPDSYCICPSSLANGYPAVVIELIRTPENRVIADEIVEALNSEFEKGRQARQREINGALDVLKGEDVW